MKPKAALIFHSRAIFRPAFTLVELLIVVVIIGVLAGLMFPMIRSMRSRADVTKCTANLRVWSLVIRSYASENNQMVRYEEWEDIGTGKKFYNPFFGAEEISWPQKKVMGPSLGYHRMCPAQKWDGSGNPPRGYLFVRPNELNDQGKYSRGEVDTNRDGKPDSYSLAKIARPSQMLMMMDANNYKNIYRTSEFNEYVKPICINSDKTQIRHGGGVNALFADGHVDFLNWSDIDPGRPENTQKVTTWLNLD
jgi:prepilin-type processing-associated H-X9-DG protein/prepilin-type N-terminal cleavage/methylation domain-containing protein